MVNVTCLGKACRTYQEKPISEWFSERSAVPNDEHSLAVSNVKKKKKERNRFISNELLN